MELLEGQFSADESARLCRNYRYAAERVMRIMAGWIALTPELSAKLLLGRHVWDNAQHADAWGKRLPELRAHAQESEPPNQAFAALMNALEAPEAPGQTVERLTGVYRMLKPHLLSVYEQHLVRANPVYEPPTCRILSRCIEDERRHVVAGETIIRHLAVSSESQARAGAWQSKLQGLLEAAGGVTGQGLPPAVGLPASPSAPVSDDAREFIRLERVQTRWPIPEDLEGAIRALGDALVSADESTLARFLSAPMDTAVLAALKAGRLASHRAVAFVKLGRHRIVKYRLEGGGGAVTLNARWEQGAEGWRVGAVDVVKIEQTQPA
ncbi:MAG: hypothetical protein DME16_07185 [Candidatus Rokuibacteriota bacterium]|nr:MAG: hypothetical protein DME16_07185 [Candidatus Rokubacteria bacterium]